MLSDERKMNVPTWVLLDGIMTEILTDIRPEMQDYWWSDEVDRFEEGNDDWGNDDTMRRDTKLPIKWRNNNRIQQYQSIWGDETSSED